MRWKQERGPPIRVASRWFPRVAYMWDRVVRKGLSLLVFLFPPFPFFFFGCYYIRRTALDFLPP